MSKNAIYVALIAGLGTVLCSGPVRAEESAGPRLHVPTFQDLMAPDVFPDPQFGMAVESVDETGDKLVVTTTGAVITTDPAAGTITIRQRIGHERPVAVLRLAGPLRGWAVTHRNEGRVLWTAEQPNITLRVNGDSLLLLQAHEPVPLEVDRKIPVAWTGSWKANHVVADEWGGFALHCSAADIADAFDPAGETVTRYALPAGEVLCVGVCPPRPYRWKQSAGDQVVHHWTAKPEEAYPAMNLIQAWAAGGNILLLQGERALWKHWQRDFTPSLGVEEFARVRDECHRIGSRLMVYASPFYYLGGSGLDDGGVVNDGANMEFFLEAIRGVMRELEPDGLYMDGQYFHNPAAIYALARHSRTIVGEDGLLEWHSTGALGGAHNHCYMPHADAYVDIQLRGEGERHLYGDRDFLRFFVSGYNINNCIGALCLSYGGYLMSPDKIDRILESNVRLHTVTDVAFGVVPSSDPQTMWVTRANESPRVHMTPAYVRYWAGLNPALRERVERDIDAHQAQWVGK